jgi:fucose permease
MHFIISTGSSFVTFFAKFFLYSSSSKSTEDLLNGTLFNNSVSLERDKNPGIVYPYLAIALYHLVLASFIVYIFVQDKFMIVRPRRLQRSPSSKEEASVVLAVLFGIPMFCFGGLEVAFSGLLLTFVTEEVGWSSDHGAYLTFTFWISLAAGRLTNTVLAKCVKPRNILAINSIGLCLTFLVTSFTYTKHSLVLWVCSSVVGITMAPAVANTLALANSYIGVRGWVTAMHMCCLYIGVIAQPAFFAYIFKTFSADGFLYCGLGVTLTSIAAYIVIEIVYRSRVKSHVAREAVLLEVNEKCLKY